MGTLGNKKIMALNIQRLMEGASISAKELSASIKVPYTTVLSWINAENYPRIDKIEKMANYFGVRKSDLVEPYSAKTSYSPTLVKLVKTAQNLNEEGQGKLSDYADDLDSSGKYRKLSDAPDTYKGKSSIIRIEPKDEQTNKKPLPFVASSSMWDEGENDEDLAEMIKKLKEDEIERG